MAQLRYDIAGRRFHFELDYDHPDEIYVGHCFHYYQMLAPHPGPFDGGMFTVRDEVIPLERPPDDHIIHTEPAFCVAMNPETGAITMGSHSHLLWQSGAGGYQRWAEFAPDFGSGTIYLRQAFDGSLSDNPLSFPMREHFLHNRLGIMGRPLCHGSHVDYEGRSLLFLGPSGMGKSTAAKLWEDAGHRVLNDEKNILYINDAGEATAATSPWHGSHPEMIPAVQPLAAIFFLEQAPENRLEPMSMVRAVSRLAANTFSFRYHPEVFARVMEAFTAVTEQVPVYTLSCTPDQRAVETVKRELAS